MGSTVAAAAPALAKLLSHNNDQVAAAAAKALARIATPDAATALGAAVKNASGDLKSPMADALLAATMGMVKAAGK